MKIGLLTTLNHPLLPFYLAEIHNKGLRDIVVICDEKSLSSSDVERIHKRTNDHFKFLEKVDPWVFVHKEITYPFYLVDSHNSEKCLKIISNEGIECLANCGTPRKLSNRLLESIDVGVLNVHPGALPKYRGCSSVEWTLFNNDELANTAHLMNEEYDAGPLLTVEKYPNNTFDHYDQIRIFMYEKAFKLMANSLLKIADNQYELTDQDENLAKEWKPIEVEDMNTVLNNLSKRKISLNN